MKGFLPADEGGNPLNPGDDHRFVYVDDGARILGVWRGPGGTAPLAWVCHRPSPFDPKRPVILLR